MQIEIYKTQKLEINADGCEMFILDKHLHDKIYKIPHFFGIAIINKRVIKFYYSPLGNDGNIDKSNNPTDDEILVLKRTIPLFVLFNSWELTKGELK
jgi:hypothetical protein